MDLDFKGIFDRHFFSNHHVEAKRLEARLEEVLPSYECITFSSFPGLLTTALDELCEEAGVYAAAEDSQLYEMNAFFRTTGRKELLPWDKEAQDRIEELRIIAGPDLSACVRAALIGHDEILGLLLDFSNRSSLLESAGLFVTQDASLAEKIRWSRSSYGRRAQAVVKIAANGRFSEFQGQLLNAALDEAGYGG